MVADYWRDGRGRGWYPIVAGSRGVCEGGHSMVWGKLAHAVRGQWSLGGQWREHRLQNGEKATIEQSTTKPLPLASVKPCVS